MEPVGEEVVRTLEIIPAKFVVHEDHYENYKCANCTGSDSEKEISKTQFLKTPHLPTVYPGSYCSASIAAYLMVQKYVMGSPLYRMEIDFMRSGIDLSRQTMSNWIIYCAETWLAPLYEKLHLLLLLAEIINADETELQVLKEPGRNAKTKSYMWLYRTGSYAEHPIVLYEYQPGRGSKYPLNFLAGFKGYLQTDGYVGYEALKEVTHVGCLAHLKRKFHDAVTVLPNGKKSGTAVEGEAYCEKLFQLERKFADLSYEERKQKRQEEAKPILDEFLAWGSTRKASSKSKLGEALTFLHNNGKELSEYLNDGRLEISNNIAERSIKPFVIDRKNFLFSNTPNGATASAVTFSIIQTAIANNLDPYAYLTYIFTEAPKLAANNEAWVEPMLPQNAPDSCKAGIKARGNV
jgi:transposase